MNLDKIREAAERQNKIQQFVAAGTMKATTGAYEMAKLSDEILRAVDEAEKDGTTTLKDPYPKTEEDWVQCEVCETTWLRGCCPGCGRKIEGGGQR